MQSGLLLYLSKFSVKSFEFLYRGEHKFIEAVYIQDGASERVSLDMLAVREKYIFNVKGFTHNRRRAIIYKQNIVHASNKSSPSLTYLFRFLYASIFRYAYLMFLIFLCSPLNIVPMPQCF